MDIEKDLLNIDEQFCWSLINLSYVALLIQPKTKIDNYNTFKEIADVYLSKYKIPYTRDTSGSSIVYRCPFLETCTFCIRGAISRSKSPGKKGIWWILLFNVGILSIKSICLQHSCKWQEVTVFHSFLYRFLEINGLQTIALHIRIDVMIIHYHNE